MGHYYGSNCGMHLQKYNFGLTFTPKAERNLIKYLIMKFDYKVNETMLSSDNKTISGSEILSNAGFKPAENYDLYKKITGREFEPIQYDETVDLSEPGIEFFKVSRRQEISFEVDDETYPTQELEMTPIQILKVVNYESPQYYLKQIKGNMEITYKNDMNKPIDMMGHLKFITCKNEPTTVS